MSGENTSRGDSALPVPAIDSSLTSRRSLRQFGLFAAGACFFGISTVITRRALVGRYKASVPKFYQQSNRPNTEINGAFEAFEALSIATINVFSIGFMATGGILWALDVSSPEDLRKKIRRKLDIDDSEGRDSAADQEMEEWIASVLERKDLKAKIKEITDLQNKRQD